MNAQAIRKLRQRLAADEQVNGLWVTLEIGAIITVLLLDPAVLCAAEADVSRLLGKKWNVLMMVIDDLNSDIGCYGHPIVQTPNIDRLAARGIRFERAYCQYPVCNPSRVSFLSGLYPTRTGVLRLNTPVRALLPDLVTLPQLFRRHGYALYSVGKIFHQPDPPTFAEGAAPASPAGQEHWDPWMEPPWGPYVRALRSVNKWQAAQDRGEELADHRCADQAIEFLRSASKDKPFFLSVGFILPHVPLIAPKRYFQMYNPSQIKLPVDFRPTPGWADDSVTTHAFRPNLDLFYDMAATPESAREAIAAYYACISFMDAQVGRVLDALREQGMGDDTVIVFFSDHGFHLGEKGMWAKMTLFERSARVPLTIAVPGMDGGRVCDRVVELTDVYPTLTDLCGLPLSGRLDGKSLRPLLVDPGTAWDKPALTMLLRHEKLAVSVRTDRWRYTEWDEGRRGIELYDHERDPFELRNLVEDPELASTRQHLHQLLRTSMNVSN